MRLYLGDLKIGINFALELEWAYIRVGLYSGFYGNQFVIVFRFFTVRVTAKMENEDISVSVKTEDIKI